MFPLAPRAISQRRFLGALPVPQPVRAAPFALDPGDCRWTARLHQLSRQSFRVGDPRGRERQGPLGRASRRRRRGRGDRVATARFERRALSRPGVSRWRGWLAPRRQPAPDARPASRTRAAQGAGSARRGYQQATFRTIHLAGADLTVSASRPVHVKPRLRGLLHAYAFFASLPALPVLLCSSRTGRATFAATVYGLSLVAMFGVSALYHRVTWSV